ncbi:unnamed protein product, partial [Iphiclides podalirius]
MFVTQGWGHRHWLTAVDARAFRAERAGRLSGGWAAGGRGGRRRAGRKRDGAGGQWAGSAGPNRGALIDRRPPRRRDANPAAPAAADTDADVSLPIGAMFNGPCSLMTPSSAALSASAKCESLRNIVNGAIIQTVILDIRIMLLLLKWWTPRQAYRK